MTVKINKPAVNLREELNELKKPTGVAGEAMLRAETPQEQFNLIGAGRKNLIINGGFDVWQRGTSFAPAAGYGYSADRARLSYNSGAGDTVTNITKQTATVDGKFVNVLRHSIVTTTNTRQVRYNHRLESPTYLTNQTVTLSFWVRASRTVALDGGSSIGDNGTGNLATIALSLGEATTTWTRKIATVTLGDCSASSYLTLVVGHTSSGANVDIDYAMFQLELGTVATPFEHRSYGEELALCQRYFNRLGGATYTGITTGMVFSNTAALFCITYPVPMRGSPTISNSNLVVSDRISYDSAITSFQPQGSSTTGMQFKTVHASNSASARQAVILCVQSSGTGYMDFNAEL